MDNIHNKISRVRKPRVHLTYDVETNGALTEQELPFVIGVLGDFAADSPLPQKALKDRKFTQIDRDNFDEVLKRLNPGLNFKIPNLLLQDNSEIPIALDFKAFVDFEPARVAEQIPELKKLLNLREKLHDFLIRIERSETLDTMLEQLIKKEPILVALMQSEGLSYPKVHDDQE